MKNSSICRELPINNYISLLFPHVTIILFKDLSALFLPFIKHSAITSNFLELTEDEMLQAALKMSMESS